MAFVFYDTETTGTQTAFDQVVQFGAIRTDADLNELDRFEIRCRLMPHVVPAPGALRATRVTPAMLTDPSLPSHYEAMRRIHTKLREWSPATFLGYNSIAFDENLMRQAFYQTLQPVYLTNTGGSMRGDVMRIVHAASVFAPNILAVPLNDNGRRTFRLDRLAPANGFAHEDAHEAVADVEATIHMSRLVKDRAPEIWEQMIGLASKQNALRFLEEQEIVTSAAVFGGNAYSRLVTHCGSNPNYDAEIAVFDLSFTPEDYLGLPVDELAAVMKRRTKPIRTIRANSQPILMSKAMAPEGAAGADLPPEELERRADLIRGNPEFRARVGEALAAQYADVEPSPYVESKIYDAFPPRTDEAIMERFHRSEWEERLKLAQRFGDPRLRELARRLIYLERPELLSERARAELYDWRGDRLLTEDPNVPWRTIPKALQEADDLLQNAEGEERVLLVSVKEFLSDLADSILGT